MSEELSEQVFQAMVKLFWGARRYSHGLQRTHGVTAAQLSALRILEKFGPLPQSQLSKRLLIRGSTLSGLLDRLQARDLIERRRSEEDRRRVFVHLTAPGEALLETIPRGQSKFGEFRRLVRQLPEEEARSFLATLHKLVEQLDPDSIPGDPVDTEVGLVDEVSDEVEAPLADEAR